MPTFKDLDVWRQAIAATELCYEVTGRFPKSEMFGLVSQMRRAAISVAANIAEGHCRRSTKAFMHHVSIALGSNGELSTLVELSHRLGYLSATERGDLDSVNELVGRLLYGLYRSLRERLLTSEE